MPSECPPVLAYTLCFLFCPRRFTKSMPCRAQRTPSYFVGQMQCMRFYYLDLRRRNLLATHTLYSIWGTCKLHLFYSSAFASWHQSLWVEIILLPPKYPNVLESNNRQRGQIVISTNNDKYFYYMVIKSSIVSIFSSAFFSTMMHAIINNPSPADVLLDYL